MLIINLNVFCTHTGIKYYVMDTITIPAHSRLQQTSLSSGLERDGR